MKVCIAVLIAMLVTVSLAEGPTREEFQEWTKFHEKSYENEFEFEMRFGVFRENHQHVLEMNEIQKHRGVDQCFGTNGPFMDMTTTEFKQKILMPSRNVNDQLEREGNEAKTELEAAQDIPEKFDWVGHNPPVLTPVRNQGTVGSCWAFSTVENIESQFALKGNPVKEFSVEQLVDCDDLDCGVFGGWPRNAMKWIKNFGGLATESSYPYCCGTGDCYPCMANKNQTFCGPPPTYCKRHCMVKANSSGLEAPISGYNVIGKNETEIQTALMKLGPLSVLLDASGLQFYHHGVYDPPKWICNDTDLDHAVLMTGWGVDDSILDKKKYWNIRNSWGEKWGQNGYFMILRGEGKCGINTYVTSATLE